VPLRLAREQLYRAADRVLARERTLRTAQDFDPVEIEQVEHRTHHDAVIDVVDIHADTGLQGEVGIVLAYAANEYGGAVKCCAALRYGDVRSDIGAVRHAAHRLAFEGFTADRRDRDRLVLQPLFTELRGDDDFPI